MTASSRLGRGGRPWVAAALAGVAALALAAQGAAAIRDEGQVGQPRRTLAAQGAAAMERKVALGVATPYGLEIGKLRRLAQSLGGRTPAIWTIWSRWGDPQTREFPTEAAGKLAELGVTPMIWWDPAKPTALDNPWYPRFANTVAGRHDRYIRRFAKAAKAFGDTVLLRYASEANGGFHAWSEGHFDNTAETFIGAWRHVWRVFKRVGAANVKFVWSVATKKCAGGCNAYTPFYPGDAYVDYLAFSSFNWGSQRPWKTMLDGFDGITARLAEISGRPVIAVESASSPDGGDKAAWIREGYPAVYAALPQIVAIVYLNADLRVVGHPDWRLRSPPAALVAYAEIAALPEYGGRIARQSGGTIADALAAEASPTRSR